MKVIHNPLKAEMGERLKKARANVGLTQQGLVDKINASGKGLNSKELRLDTLKKWESGENGIPVEWFPVLCDVLCCDTGYLFGEYPQFRRVAADVCKETGLSEKAVNAIREYIPSNRADWGLDAINAMIESRAFLDFIYYMTQFADSRNDSKIEIGNPGFPNGLDRRALYRASMEDAVSRIASEISDKFSGRTDNRALYSILIRAEQEGLVSPARFREIADRIERGDYSDFET